MWTKKKIVFRIVIPVFTVVIIFLLISYFGQSSHDQILLSLPGQNPLMKSNSPAGFWQGLIHGFVAPVSLFVSIFERGDVNIYEVRNVGIYYNIGFLLGLYWLYNIFFDD